MQCQTERRRRQLEKAHSVVRPFPSLSLSSHKEESPLATHRRRIRTTELMDGGTEGRRAREKEPCPFVCPMIPVLSFGAHSDSATPRLVRPSVPLGEADMPPPTPELAAADRKVSRHSRLSSGYEVVTAPFALSVSRWLISSVVVRLLIRGRLDRAEMPRDRGALGLFLLQSSVLAEYRLGAKEGC